MEKERGDFDLEKIQESSTSTFGIPLDIFVASWNIGNAIPHDIGLLIPEEGGDYDMIVLGFQESTYKLQDSTYPITGIDDASVLDLKQKIENILGREYVKATTITIMFVNLL